MPMYNEKIKYTEVNAPNRHLFTLGAYKDSKYNLYHAILLACDEKEYIQTIDSMKTQYVENMIDGIFCDMVDTNEYYWPNHLIKTEFINEIKNFEYFEKNSLANEQKNAFFYIFSDLLENFTFDEDKTVLGHYDDLIKLIKLELETQLRGTGKEHLSEKIIDFGIPLVRVILRNVSHSLIKDYHYRKNLESEILIRQFCKLLNVNVITHQGNFWIDKDLNTIIILKDYDILIEQLKAKTIKQFTWKDPLTYCFREKEKVKCVI